MEKKEHPQAKWLRAIADGETIQCDQCNPEGWKNLRNENVFDALAGGFDFNTSLYRIKPKTITIGKYEVAEPIRTVPLGNTPYFFVSPGATDNVDKGTWIGFSIEMRQLHSGMCWLKREDAELAAKAITELLTGKAT